MTSVKHRQTNTHTPTQNIHTEYKLRKPFLRPHFSFSIFLSLLVWKLKRRFPIIFYGESQLAVSFNKMVTVQLFNIDNFCLVSVQVNNTDKMRKSRWSRFFLISHHLKISNLFVIFGVAHLLYNFHGQGLRTSIALELKLKVIKGQ